MATGLSGKAAFCLVPSHSLTALAWLRVRSVCPEPVASTQHTAQPHRRSRRPVPAVNGLGPCYINYYGTNLWSVRNKPGPRLTIRIWWARNCVVKGVPLDDALDNPFPILVMPITTLTCYLVGTESLLIQCAEIWLAHGHAIRGVISADARISDWARERDVTIIEPGPGMVDRMGAHPFDYLFSVTNLRMLSGDVLRLADRASINFHDGPLPEYAGLNCPVWALLEGATRYGVTWHLMEDRPDTGERIITVCPGIADGRSKTVAMRKMALLMTGPPERCSAGLARVKTWPTCTF